MKAIIWKELRENVKWAALGGGAIMLAMIYALHGQGQLGRAPQTILTEKFLMVTTFGFAVLAAALGFLQTFGESRRDHWAFLLHRPISRTRIFFGKVIAGLLLYIIATGGPLLLAATWASGPGQFAAPFDWGITQAGVADLLAGAVHYFAALLTALRQARWYVSKALSFGVAIVVSLIVSHTPQLWHALLTIALTALILLIAAWGSFNCSGVYTHQRRPAKAALGLVTVAGIIIVGGVVVTFVVSLLQGTPPSYEHVQYNIARDGTVVRMTYTHGGFKNITDLNGNPVEELSDLKILSHQDARHLLLQGQSISIAPISKDQNINWYQRSYRYYNHWFVNMEQSYRSEYWYFDLHSKQLLGFDARTRRLIACGGPQGFVDSSQPLTKSFGRWLNVDINNYQTGWLFVDLKAAYVIDCTSRSVNKIFSADSDVTLIGGGGRNIAQADPLQNRTPTVIATDKRLVFRADKNQPWRQITHEPDTVEYPNVTIMTVPGKPQAFLRYSPNLQKILAGKTADKLMELDGDNRIVHRYDLKRESPDIKPDRVTMYFTGVAMPPVLLTVLIAIQWIADLAAGTPGLRTHNMVDKMMRWEWIIAMSLSMLICAGLNRHLAIRYRFEAGARRWWMLWGLLLTPAGVVLMYCLPQLPPRVRCASCGQRRLVDRDNCEHCNAAFPDPPRDGTEIFDKPGDDQQADIPVSGSPA